MLRTTLTALFLGLTACQSPQLAVTLVQLRTGPATDLEPEAMQKLFAGHFANMERLAKAQRLLVAGPYGAKKHAGDLRGVFVLDTSDRAEATAWAETDPTTQAGVFVLEYHDLVTDAPLRAMLERDLARMAEQQASGEKPSPGEGARGYVLLTAADGERAAAVLRGHSGVLMSARHDGNGWFAVLDAQRTEDAQTLLGSALARIGPHVLDDWFASKGLAELADLSPAASR